MVTPPRAVMITASADSLDALLNLQPSLEARTDSEWLQNQTASQGHSRRLTFLRRVTRSWPTLNYLVSTRTTLQIQAKENTIRVSGKKTASYPEGSVQGWRAVADFAESRGGRAPDDQCEMRERSMKKQYDDHELTRDYDGLVHPSQVFGHPSDVANDPDLSLNEKRAILAAFDACVIEAAPALRKAPAGRVVQFDDIMDALRAQDKQMAASQSRQSARGYLRTVTRGVGGNSNQGAPLH